VDIKYEDEYEEVNNKHFLALCSDLSYAYIYYHCAHTYYYVTENDDSDKIDLTFFKNMSFSNNIYTFLRSITTNTNVNYRLKSKLYPNIYCQKEHTLTYIKKISDLDKQRDLCEEIIRCDWMEAIIWLLKENVIKMKQLLRRWIYMKVYLPIYWYKHKSTYKKLSLKYENSFQKDDIKYLYTLFPGICLNNMDNKNSAAHALSFLDDVNLAYLLGMPIHSSTINIDKKSLKNKLDKLINMGSDKYYKMIILQNKKNMQKWDIKNNENSLSETIFNYFPTDIFIDHSGEVSHLFTREEFQNMHDRNSYINYYTKKNLSHLAKTDIMRRIDIVNHYTLPPSAPMAEIYKYYMDKGILCNIMSYTRKEDMLEMSDTHKIYDIYMTELDNDTLLTDNTSLGILYNMLANYTS
jgi:hypothetical protein